MTVRIRITHKRPRVGRFGIIQLNYNQFWPESEVAPIWPNGVKNVSRPRRNDRTPPIPYGLPDTAIFADGTRVLFDHDLQVWIHGICSRGQGGYGDDFRSLWRGKGFMTNGAGVGPPPSQMCADYINGENLDNDLPKIAKMACGGALVNIVDEDDEYITFEAINAQGDYRQYSPATHPWLFFCPVNSRLEVVNGTLREDLSLPFSQYDGMARIPIFAHGDSDTNKIEKWRVRILGSNEPVPSPFVTAGYTVPNPYEGF